MACLFCELQHNAGDVLYENDAFYAVYDIRPVSPGHALVIAKKHINSFFDLDAPLAPLLLDALSGTRKKIDEKYGPAAYNIGVNDGSEAGRVIPHLHVHLIPRYAGEHGKGIEIAMKQGGSVRTAVNG